MDLWDLWHKLQREKVDLEVFWHCHWVDWLLHEHLLHVPYVCFTSRDWVLQSLDIHVEVASFSNLVLPTVQVDAKAWCQADKIVPAIWGLPVAPITSRDLRLDVQSLALSKVVCFFGGFLVNATALMALSRKTHAAGGNDFHFFENAVSSTWCLIVVSNYS